MTTACPCFGRNENCRLCGGSGLVSSDVEARAARANFAAQTSYYSGQSEEHKRDEAKDEARRGAIIQEIARKAAEADAAKKARQASQIEAARRLDAAAREAQTPAWRLATKAKQEQDARNAAERAAADAKQAERAIAYWNRLWGKR